LFHNIIEWLKKLFGVKAVRKTELEQSQEAAFVAAYEDINEVNIVNVVANKMANKVCAEADIEVTGPKRETPDGKGGARMETVESERAGFLNDALKRVVRKLNMITARVFGTGGVVLKPYVYNGQIYTDILPQDRMAVIEQAGEVVTKAGFLADRFEDGESVYKRMEFHSLDGQGNYTIENRAMKDDVEVPLKSVPGWAGIEPLVVITGVERMLWAMVACPVDNRKDAHSIYGVPVTYGQEKLIKMAVDLINEVPDEYKNKKAFVGADEALFRDERGRQALPESGLYKLFRATGGVDSQSFWEIFSPEIRHTAYFTGIEYIFGLLEKGMALNKGILTDMQTQNATATEIRRSTADTFSTVDGMRDKLEEALTHLVYAFDVIANAFGLAPEGEYELNFDWSYELLEDSQETFDQIERTVAAGGLGVEHLTAYTLDIPVGEAVKYVPGKKSAGEPEGEKAESAQ